MWRKCKIILNEIDCRIWQTYDSNNHSLFYSLDLHTFGYTIHSCVLVS